MKSLGLCPGLEKSILLQSVLSTNNVWF